MHLRELLKRFPFWAILFVLIVVVLGLIGVLINQPLSWNNFFNALYYTIIFFVFHPGQPEEYSAIILIARFLAAILVISGIYFIMKEKIVQVFSIGKIKVFYKNHIIICGLGEIGYRIAKDILDESIKGKTKLVILENNINNPYVDKIKKQGVKVLIYNAFRIKSLKNAGIDQASLLIIAMGEDHKTVEMLHTFCETRKCKRKQFLKLLINFNDWKFHQLYMSTFGNIMNNMNVDVNTFNINYQGAKMIMDKFPFYKKNPGEIVYHKISIIGFNEVAELFLLENAILSQNPEQKDKLTVNLFHFEPDQIKKLLNHKYPFLEEFLEMDFHKIHDIHLYDEEYKREFKAIYNESDKIYLFGEDDASLIDTSIYLRQFSFTTCENDLKIPIIVCLPENLDILNLCVLKDEKDNEDSFYHVIHNSYNIHFVKLFTDTCRKKIIIDESQVVDYMARMVDYIYFLGYVLPGHLLNTDNSLKKDSVESKINARKELILNDMINLSWNDFVNRLETEFLDSLEKGGLKNISPEDISIENRWQSLSDLDKESNRYVARQVDYKELYRLKYKNAGNNDAEIMLKLSEMEHKRWCAEKKIFGFKFADITQLADFKKLRKYLKLRSDLIDFEKLSDSSKGKDIDNIRSLNLLTTIKNNND